MVAFARDVIVVVTGITEGIGLPNEVITKTIINRRGLGVMDGHDLLHASHTLTLVMSRDQIIACRDLGHLTVHGNAVCHHGNMNFHQDNQVLLYVA